MTDPDPKHEARQTARTVAEEARRAESEAETLAKRARAGAGRRFDQARQYAQHEANARVSEATDGAAREAERAARAASDAAADYPSDRLEVRALEGVSRLLEDTASSLRSTDLDTVSRELTRFARRNPVSFMAGAAAVGFAAARLLRAGPEFGERFEEDEDFPEPGSAGMSADYAEATGAEARASSPVERDDG
ncbi:hypothetical protein [Rhodosalinus sp.]|uniref:hypothetical protein n=1 Tax=Rhodosalinus sp. TaxID=2047741 RepID=UPI00397A6EF9